MNSQTVTATVFKQVEKEASQPVRAGLNRQPKRHGFSDLELLSLQPSKAYWQLDDAASLADT